MQEAWIIAIVTPIFRGNGTHDLNAKAASSSVHETGKMPKLEQPVKQANASADAAKSESSAPSCAFSSSPEPLSRTLTAKASTGFERCFVSALMKLTAKTTPRPA
jgi:hypothetical protein